MRLFSQPNDSSPPRDGYRLLRGHVILRTPTREELASRSPIILTERDAEILAAVHLHGFLSVEVIELAFFPPPPGGRSAYCSAAYERLRLLWLWRYLDRLQFPVARGVGGSRPVLYTLGPQGVAVVATHLLADRSGVAAIRRRRLDRLNEQFLEHDLTAAALWANVRALLRGAPVRRWWWEPERDLRARRLRVKDPAERRWYPFVPDGYFQIEYRPDGAPSRQALVHPHGEHGDHDQHGAPGSQLWCDYRCPRPGRGPEQCVVVEVDLGTLDLGRFKRKLHGFELALDQGLFAQEWGRGEFEVLVLTTTDERLDHVWQAAREVVAGDRWSWYSFGTLAALDPPTFSGYGWRTLRGDRVQLLVDPTLTEVTPPEPAAGAAGVIDGASAEEGEEGASGVLGPHERAAASLAAPGTPPLGTASVEGPH